MANLFRMTTGGGGTIGIDPSPYGTGIKAVITGEAPLNAEQATLDATANPAVESDTRKWNITSGSDIEDIITLDTEIWTPSTVVNVALDDGDASHTHATAADVVKGHYFWDADGEYKQGTTYPANIPSSTTAIKYPTLVTHNTTKTYQTFELLCPLNQADHAIYYMCASDISGICSTRTYLQMRGLAIIPKSYMSGTSENDFSFLYRSTDGTTTDGKIYWKYVDDTHLEIANTYVKDLYISIFAFKFAA